MDPEMDCEPSSSRISQSDEDAEDFREKEDADADLQRALRNSRDTACFEEEKREQDQQEIVKLLENDLTIKTKKSGIPQPKPTRICKEKSNLNFLSKSNMNLSPSDLSGSICEFLQVIYHSPVYDLPIPTNRKFKHLGLEARAQLLSDYSLNLQRNEAALARTSHIMAPWPKPLIPTHKESHIPSKAEEETDSQQLLFNKSVTDHEDEVTQLYTSRSGRMTKRKIYVDDDSDNDFDQTTTKKNKSTSDPDAKITMDSVFDDLKKSDKPVTKAQPRTYNKKDSIKSTPSLSLRKEANSRSQLINKNLKIEEEKKKQEEQKMRKFEKSLNEDVEKMIIDDNSPSSSQETKIRVIPPTARGKGGGVKRQARPTQEDFDKIESVPSTTRKTPPRKCTNKTPLKTTPAPAESKAKESHKPEEPTTSTSKVDCPICGKFFTEAEIEHHASECGIEEDNETQELNEVASPVHPKRTMKCEICNNVLPFNENYQVHVAHCLANNVVQR